MSCMSTSLDNLKAWTFALGWLTDDKPASIMFQSKYVSLPTPCASTSKHLCPQPHPCQTPPAIRSISGQPGSNLAAGIFPDNWQLCCCGWFKLCKPTMTLIEWSQQITLDPGYLLFISWIPKVADRQETRGGAFRYKPRRIDLTLAKKLVSLMLNEGEFLDTQMKYTLFRTWGKPYHSESSSTQLTPYPRCSICSMHNAKFDSLGKPDTGRPGREYNISYR